MKIYTSSAETGLTSKKRLSIAKRSIDPKELSRLAYDNAPSVRVAVLRNKYTPKNIVDQLEHDMVNDKNADVRWEVANKTTDPDILAKLADDPSPGVREAVAWKTNDPNILTKLADDESKNVLRAVAQRTDDLDILARLADNEDWQVRKMVAEATNDPDIIARLADDEDADVRWAVAHRTDDPDILVHLADDENKNVRIEVVQRTDDPDILAQLADDPDWGVRLEVAKKVTDPNILAKLADDKDTIVRRTARKRYEPARSNSTKSRRPPQSDWSIPLYSINNYSEIEGEITKVISDAANEFARKYMGESAQVEVAPGAYDSSTGVVKIHVGDNIYTIDVEDILPPATSKQKKRDCVKTLVAWMQNNLPAATDETMTMM